MSLYTYVHICMQKCTNKCLNVIKTGRGRGRGREGERESMSDPARAQPCTTPRTLRFRHAQGPVCVYTCVCVCARAWWAAVVQWPQDNLFFTQSPAQTSRTRLPVPDIRLSIPLCGRMHCTRFLLAPERSLPPLVPEVSQSQLRHCGGPASWSLPLLAAQHSQPRHFPSQRAKGKTRCWFPAAGFSTLLSLQLGSARASLLVSSLSALEHFRWCSHRVPSEQRRGLWAQMPPQDQALINGAGRVPGRGNDPGKERACHAALTHLARQAPRPQRSTCALFGGSHAHRLLTLAPAGPSGRG